MLSTFGFRARPFYERLGYEVVADMPGHPVGRTHRVLKETLD